MRRKSFLFASVMLLSSSILLSSCIGSFSLFNKLLAWNKSVSDKWINELVFIVISPAYAVAGVVDALVLNSIEFWTGDNPAASAQVQTVEGEDGNYLITTTEEGHEIQKEGEDEVVAFLFDKENNSWSVGFEGETTPLLQLIDDETALVYLQDGSTMTVNSDQQSLYALKQVIAEKSFYATK